MLGERSCYRLHDDVVERDLVFVAELRHSGTHFGGALEVELGGQVERRDGTNRLGEASGDGLADLGERDVAIVLTWRGSHCGAVRPLRRSDAGSRFDIALDDATAGPGPTDRSEVESFFCGQASSQR